MKRNDAGRGAADAAGRALPVDEVPCRLDTKLTLGQFLKLANLIDSGAEAKAAIADGEVEVNGDVDTRRGRGLVAGDEVTFAGRVARVVDASDPDGQADAELSGAEARDE